MSDPIGGADPNEEKRREAEREVRHGNFRGALALFKELAAADPGNAAYAARIATLEEGLQPMELHHPKAAAGAAARPLANDLQEGEAAANVEDYARAVACYRRVVAADPDNELAADRLQELEGLLAAQATAPKPGISAQAMTPSAAATRERSFSASLFDVDEPEAAPAPAAVPEDPRDPIALLELFLERIQARRRPLRGAAKP
ncbi:MAG: hypothetical protein P1V51_06305 [Deltaproteobacteria bacterium]|nr:hypothetical protein [Deltaproteobacteria bacterium]